MHLLLSQNFEHTDLQRSTTVRFAALLLPAWNTPPTRAHVQHTRIHKAFAPCHEVLTRKCLGFLWVPRALHVPWLCPLSPHVPSFAHVCLAFCFALLTRSCLGFLWAQTSKNPKTEFRLRRVQVLPYSTLHRPRRHRRRHLVLRPLAA
jgi:hypothetical protein